MDVRKKDHVQLPLDLYKKVRPAIEDLVLTTGRPMTYREVRHHLFKLLGCRKAPSSAQLGQHIARSKKLEKFRYGHVMYVVSAAALSRFMNKLEATM